MNSSFFIFVFILLSTSLAVSFSQATAAGRRERIVGKDFGPVPESTCTSFQNAFWCPSTFICTVSLNDSAAANTHCQDRCPGLVPCTDFSTCRTCASNERNCGDCMFAGGVWSVKKQLCVPQPRDCDSENDKCIVEDSECETCERYNRPVSCLTLFPVAVSVLIVALIFATVGSVWAIYHWKMPVETEDQSAVTRLPPPLLSARESARETRNASMRMSATLAGQQHQQSSPQFLVPATAGGVGGGGSSGSGSINMSTANSPRVSVGDQYYPTNSGGGGGGSPRRSSNAHNHHHTFVAAGESTNVNGKPAILIRSANGNPVTPNTSAKPTKWGTVRTAVILTKPVSPNAAAAASSSSGNQQQQQMSKNVSGSTNKNTSDSNNSPATAGTPIPQSPTKTPRGSVVLVKAVNSPSGTTTPPLLSSKPHHHHHHQHSTSTPTTASDQQQQASHQQQQQQQLKPNTTSDAAQEFLQRQRGTSASSKK